MRTITKGILNDILDIFIVILSASGCFCYAGYELFQGFSVTDVDDTSDATTEVTVDSISDLIRSNQTSRITPETKQILTTILVLQNSSTITHATPMLSNTSNLKRLKVHSSSSSYKDLTETITLRHTKTDCPENEKPSNIGPYEIPTDRDMVLFTRNILLDMFNSYNTHAFYLLKDIKAATKATSSIENKCKGNKMAYRKCIKFISKQCEQVTKNLVKGLENLKQEISNLTEVKICKLSEMTTDPINILKSLAQEKVYLEFALPGFLRLINGCASNCNRATSSYIKKPMRHMTDQDLVIKHFLTHKNYLELIMDSRHKTAANSN